MDQSYKNTVRTEDGEAEAGLTIDKLSTHTTGPVWRREERNWGEQKPTTRVLSQTLDLLAFAGGSSPDLSLGLAQVSPVVEKEGGGDAGCVGPNPDLVQTQD